MPVLDFGHLSPEQRLQLIGELWDSLDQRDIPIPDWHKAEIDRRMALIESGETEWFTLDEIEAGIDHRKA